MPEIPDGTPKASDGKKQPSLQVKHGDVSGGAKIRVPFIISDIEHFSPSGTSGYPKGDCQVRLLWPQLPCVTVEGVGIAQFDSTNCATETN